MSPEPYPKALQLGEGRLRRQTRKRASKAEWRALHAAKQGPCRVCDRPPTNQLHHLISRAQLGPDTFDNLIPLCLPCHERVERREREALLRVAESLTDGEYAFIVGRLGEGATERLFGV